jgi:hypothetical protein
VYSGVSDNAVSATAVSKTLLYFWSLYYWIRDVIDTILPESAVSLTQLSPVQWYQSVRIRSVRIQTVLIGSGSGRLGPDPNPCLYKWYDPISTFLVSKKAGLYKSLLFTFLIMKKLFIAYFRQKKFQKKLGWNSIKVRIGIRKFSKVGPGSRSCQKSFGPSTNLIAIEWNHKKDTKIQFFWLLLTPNLLRYGYIY